MTTFTRTWNPAYEANPADSQNASQGAARIRETKTDVQERLVVDHSMAGDVDDGTHKKVTLVDPLAVKPTQINDETYLYSKDVNATSELFYEDESGNEVQLTELGRIGAKQRSWWKGADIASATNIVIGTDGNYFDITGTVTIASLDTEEVGTVFKLHFDTILTLTYHATNLVLPGGVDIVTEVGDEAEFIEYAAGLCRCIGYTRFSGRAVIATLAPDSVTNTEIATDAVNADSIIVGGVGQSEIGANAVGQSEIKTSSQSLSDSVPAGGSGTLNFTPSGGVYTLGSTMRASVANANNYIALTQLHLGLTTSNVAGWQMASVSDSVAFTAYANLYYITASKPYDLGDGEVGRFIFAIIDNTTSNIDSISHASEAPWHYNGPTNTRGKLAKNGKRYIIHKDMSNIPYTLAEARLDSVKLAAYTVAFKNAPMIKKEITQKIKQADMNLIPHPFMNNNLTGKTVVMLDPVSDLNHELAEMCNCYDEFNLNKLLHEGDIKVSNTGLKRSGPAGILIPSFKWR